jgi:hypothetical protein
MRMWRKGRKEGIGREPNDGTAEESACMEGIWTGTRAGCKRASVVVGGLGGAFMQRSGALGGVFIKRREGLGGMPAFAVAISNIECGSAGPAGGFTAVARKCPPSSRLASHLPLPQGAAKVEACGATHPPPCGPGQRHSAPFISGAKRRAGRQLRQSSRRGRSYGPWGMT